MKGLKKKIVLSVLVVLSLFVISGNGWTQQVGMPHAFFSGLVETYLDNGVNDDLVFLYTTINSVVYDPGSPNDPNTDSILGATVTLSGAKRDPLAVPGTTFTPATISMSDGVTTYFTANLINIEFELINGLWRLNPDLDINTPATMNLTNIVLNPGPIPSNYIIELQAQLAVQNIAGMKMTLFTFSGDITGDSQSAIFEGLFDGVPLNAPPDADAGLTTTNTTCSAASCEVILDGSQSSDPDSTPGTNDDIETFEWIENSVVIATGETAPVTLALGMHDITLRVTDFAGATDEVTITVFIDPAELAFDEIDKAYVKRDGKIKVRGRIALPAGVTHLDVNSTGRAILGLRTLDNIDITAIDESVDFTEHSNGNKWKYSASPALGIKKFSIDWDGAKFSYSSLQHDLYIKTDHIGENETELEIRTCAVVTIDINGTQIIIDANNDVSCSNAGVKIDADDDGDSDDSDSDGGAPSDDDGDCTIGVTLPFALTPDMDIIVSGDINETIPVGTSGYSVAVGKFKLHGRFDATSIDFTSLTPWLETTITLGDQGFAGTLVIDEATWTKIKSKHWQYKSH